MVNYVWPFRVIPIRKRAAVTGTGWLDSIGDRTSISLFDLPLQVPRHILPILLL